MSDGASEPRAVAAEGSDFYYASLYLGPLQRSAAFTLEALRRELGAIPAQCSDAGIAHLKLAWWRDELTALGQTQARHPLTLGIAPLAARDPALANAYVALIDGLAATLQPQRLASRESVLKFVETVHGAALDARSRHTAPASSMLGVERLRLACLVELARALCDLRRHRHATTPLLATAQLAAHGLDLQSVRDAPSSDSLRDFLSEEIDFVRREIIERLETMAASQRRAERLLVTLARITVKTLDLTAAAGYRLLEQRVEPTPVHKLWLAWRTARLG